MKPILSTNIISSYPDQVVNIFNFDTGVKSINEYCSRVELLSEQFISEEDPDNKKPNKFKGDITELLSEIFFGAHGNSPRVGVSNYCPVPSEDDYGVDAIGINVNGDAVAIQVKYRSNPSNSIDLDSMAKTYLTGRRKHGLDLDKNDTVFLFTTTYDVTVPTKHVCENMLRVVDRYIISDYIDNNVNFWKEAEERISLTIDILNKG